MKTEQGFTLIELMVTLAVAAILITIAVPGFRSIIQNNRATTAANNLLTAMTLARSESIKLGTPVSVCSTVNQLVCTDDPNWATGWMVFADSDNSGLFNDSGNPTLCETANNAPSEDCLLRVWSQPKGNPVLTQTAGGNSVRYTTTGLVVSSASFTLTMPGSSTNQTRYICINPTGRASVSTSACP